jgi:hypothetical protein
LQLAGNPKLIIPGHDPAVFEKFPKLNDPVVKIEERKGLPLRPGQEGRMSVEPHWIFPTS